MQSEAESGSGQESSNPGRKQPNSVNEAASSTDNCSRANHEADDATNSNNNIATNPQQQPQASASSSQGYYDAEKCRAYIASQTRVSKIDRVAAQIARALEVETGFQSRLANVLNLFQRHTASVATAFAAKCKFGLKRHRQDRILNFAKRRRGAASAATGALPKYPLKATRARQADRRRGAGDYLDEEISISNDLLYGEGVRLVHELLSQPMTISPPIRLSRKSSTGQHATGGEQGTAKDDARCLATKIDTWDDAQFEPELYAKKLEDYLRISLRKSRLVCAQLNRIRSTFERLATEHRDQVDVVYAAEENRQATTVIRRSAYNLSMAAIKATSTPVHVSASVVGVGRVQ